MIKDELGFPGMLLSKQENDRILKRLQLSKGQQLTDSDIGFYAKWYVEDVLTLAKQAKYFADQFELVSRLLREARIEK